MAEWLGRALQKLVQRFESASDLEKSFRKNSEAFLVIAGVFREINHLGIFPAFFLQNGFP